MPFSLRFGVFQRIWSTPGVLLPGFSVTRFTASALPLNEWVSRCCRACTLALRPSFPGGGAIRAYRVPLEGPDGVRFSLSADGVRCPCQGNGEPLDPP